MKRTAAQREIDLDKLDEMRAQGKSQAEMGQVLGVEQCQISRDMKALRERWKKRRGPWDRTQDAELATIDYVAKEAHAAWQRSKQEATSTSTKKITAEAGGDKPGSTRNEARVDKEHRDGNPAFLGIVLDCSRQRIDLLRPAQKRLTLDTLGELLDALPYDAAIELRAYLGGAHSLPGPQEDSRPAGGKPEGA